MGLGLGCLGTKGLGTGLDNILDGWTHGHNLTLWAPIRAKKDDLKNSRLKMATPSPACLTRTMTGNISDDQDHDQDNFGYCPDNCAGEMPSPSSPYNLAASKHRQYWYSHFYDLSSYENGYCHTFNPPHKSVPGLENRVYFMINNITWLYSRAYDLFLHERGQFWPRLDMFSLGQSDPVKLELDSDVEVRFSLNQITTHPVPRTCHS